MTNSIVKEYFDKGLEALLEDDIDNEKDKVGNLRGGNSGIYFEDKNKQLVAGKCQRLSYLRMKGVSVGKTDPPRKLMFQAGISNEDIWYETLKRTYPYKILRETEVPTSWMTDNDISVTGRPDIVLLDADDKPKVGIELKLVSSLWTARDVLFEGRPKFDHLIQAAHYSWQLKIPFELWYTNRVDFATNDMANRCLPDYGTDKFDRLKQHLDIRYYKKVMSKTGNMYGKPVDEQEFLAGRKGYKEGQYYASPIKIYPFRIGYILDWNKDTGRLMYTNIETMETEDTIITKQSIYGYYNFVSKMASTKDLGPRPVTLKGDGSSANYSQCSYCPLNKLCDTVTDFDKWEREVPNHVK